MLKFVYNDNMFDNKHDYIVNTINCVSVCGRGVALQVKKLYPNWFVHYKIMCKQGKIKPGTVYNYFDISGQNIISMATKDHWIDPSKLEWVEQGILNLRDYLLKISEASGDNVVTVGMPVPGCGNGKLHTSMVKPIISACLDNIKNIDVTVYLPQK